MRFLAISRFIAVATLGLMTSAQAKITSNDYWIGNYWSVSANYEDGHFTFCLVEATYKNGITLAFSLTSEYNIMAWLTKPGWNVPVGSRFVLTASVDNRWSDVLDGMAITPELIAFKINPERGSIKALREGRVLTLSAERDSWQFNLDGSAKAFLMLSRCVTDHSRPSDPFTQETNPFTTSNAPDQGV